MEALEPDMSTGGRYKMLIWGGGIQLSLSMHRDVYYTKMSHFLK